MRHLIVNIDNLNVRNEPSALSDVTGTLYFDEIVSLIKFSDDWRWVEIRADNGLIGWSPYKYFLGVANHDRAKIDDCDWLKIAFGELGTQELPGLMENQRIVQYLNTCELSLPKINATSDETSWCSAFINWCMESAGYSGTNDAWALSWRHWGQEIDNPERGAIAVFKRFVLDDGKIKTYGHVGFYLNMDPNDLSKIEILGGNQRNKVCIMSFPVKGKQYELVGYRMP